MNKFNRFEMITSQEFVQYLNNKTILIVGIGGVGGYVVESLIRSGIGNVVIVDHDIIDQTNINRQIIALNSTVGLNKVDVLEKRINDINENCSVEKHQIFLNEETDNLIDYSKVDFIVDACDTILTKKLLIRNAIKHNKKIISCMGTGNKFDPSKLEITDIRKTSYDPLARIIRNFVVKEQIKEKIDVLCSKEQPIKIQQKTPGSTSFVPPSAGLLITSHIIKYFLNTFNN